MHEFQRTFILPTQSLKERNYFRIIQPARQTKRKLPSLLALSPPLGVGAAKTLLSSAGAYAFLGYGIVLFSKKQHSQIVSVFSFSSHASRNGFRIVPKSLTMT